jgi:hypothetical protein
MNQSSRRLVQRFITSPPPGAGASAPSTGHAAPPLPVCNVGAPPGAPPSLTRPAPRVGGFRGQAIPPELRRRIPGGVRSAPGAANVVRNIRLALGKAQRKLLESQLKLASSAALLRTKLTSRQ